MKLGEDGFFHLTYCTKIHPGHGWGRLFQNLKRYVPQLRERLAPGVPFGLGLRLSDLESRELVAGENLKKFQEFLTRNDAYVFTLNGFPYGSFHGEEVKSQAFAPDWRDDARLRYTLRLIGILQTLLPPGLEGSISTLPLSYKPWLAPDDPEALTRITLSLTRVAAVLLRVRQETGAFIHLDLEPEPDGLLETCQEVEDFFSSWLLPLGAPLLSQVAGVSPDRAEDLLREHIQVCLDTCHLAVAFEDGAEAVAGLSRHGIRVGKVQVTAGLKATVPPDPRERARLAADLAPFARSPYLHQVVASGGNGGKQQFRDLSEALPSLGEAGGQQWRLHFHMPLFVENYGGLAATQAETRALLRLLREQRFCRHLELETYTWGVLPEDLKEGLLESLLKEYRWVLETLDLEPQGPGPGADAPG